MPPKPTADKKPPAAAAGGGGDVRLLQDLETLSKALSLDPKKLPASRSISAGRSNPNPKNHDSSSSSSSSSKKAPFWKSWKPLRALSHIRSRRFECRFSLHVHSVDGLPQPFSGSSLVVRWKRTTDPSGSSSSTRPVRVFGSSAEFEEVLSYRCSVYGTRSGSSGAAKYEPRHFLIWVSVLDSPGTDLGRNLVDLTRLLPLTLEELEEEEKSSGKWSTSFKLSGKGKGSSISVSFGFSLAGEGSADGRCRRASRSQSVENVKVLHEVLPSSRSEVLAVAAKAKIEGSVGSLSPDLKKTRNTEEESAKAELERSGGSLSPGLKTCNSEEVEVVKGDEEKACEEPEFMVIEQGIETASEDPILEPKLEKEKVEFEIREETEMVNLEKIEVESGRVDEGDATGEHEVEKVDEEAEGASNDNRISEGQEMGDLEAEFSSLPVVDWEKLESPEVESITPRRMSYGEVKSSYKAEGSRSKSLSLDDETVASEFLNMLGIDHSPFGLFSSDSDPESPRERLLKQFERESLNTSTGLFGVDIGSPKEPDWPDADFTEDFAEDFDLSMIVHEAETEFRMEMGMGMGMETGAMDSKSRAKLMEDAETEALMRQYGIDEKVFQGSTPTKRSGFGSPIDLPPEEPLELPPLCEGLGPFVQTKDGGFLRSMSPSLFKNAKNNGHLIMQVSSPVVVPAEMGSGIMEILGRLASVGIEKLSMQAKKLMPLEDITGKTMQQIAWEAAPALEACERQDQLHHLKASIESAVGQVASRGSKRGRSPNHASSGAGEMASEYVSIEDLAPLAMDKIEALSVEGLRIQSGMSDEEAPSNISPQSIGEISALEGKGAVNSMSLGMEGTGGLQLLDVKDSGDVVDGLMGLSITLDEWMRLDSGIVDEEDEISDRTSKVLAAHHARATDMITGGSKRGGRRSGKRWGLLGNNFTVALMVQLRDPLRNYEPVGTPMLSLIQVERVFVPPKPKIYNTVSEKGNSGDQDDDEPETKTELETNKEKKEEEDNIPQFKITEVHMTGLKTEPGKKKPWGNPVQQQSGSRWLLATGMGKSNKHPFMKSKAASKPSPVTATVQPGDSLWSISSRVHGSGSKWRELLALNPHIRNPNVILPNETIRLK
ncbi:protein PLASTID MOVEMENT IMPAIRED 1-RELATED 1-like [Iris pallida]|uniref:Protein PLASTID MOVEMENT IMPAIRED 1-RELATED 1-like n=1 Tax=Iris pallida TaxID=29817 RepID=A0AAX6DS88_IRIPA|nr:protein PLASTID MOVEMENT IMPAIRED 1-RELATED 1-like [Iris pallida]